MIIRSLVLGGMTSLLMTLSAAAAVSSPAQIGSPLSAQPIAQRDWTYYQCQTDDGYGRHRPCDSSFKGKHKK